MIFTIFCRINSVRVVYDRKEVKTVKKKTTIKVYNASLQQTEKERSSGYDKITKNVLQDKDVHSIKSVEIGGCFATIKVWINKEEKEIAGDKTTKLLKILQNPYDLYHIKGTNISGFSGYISITAADIIPNEREVVKQNYTENNDDDNVSF